MRLANLSGGALFALAVLALQQGAAVAATKTWDGGATPNAQWTTATNWSTDVAPVAGDDLVFAGGANLSTTNNFAADTSFLDLSFDAAAGGFTLAGNRVALPQGLPNGIDLSLNTGTTFGGGIKNNSANPQTVSLPLQLLDGKHIIQTTAAGGNLNLSGAITRNTGGVVNFDPFAGSNINVNGSGLTRDSSDGGGILGGWAVLGGNGANNVIGSSIGGDWATLDGSGNIVPYTGYTDITVGGAVTSSATANLRYIGGADATFNITAADGTLINSLLLANANTGRNLTVTGTMKLGSANPGGASGGMYKVAPASAGNFTFTVTGGTLTANGGGELTFSDSNYPTATTGNGGLSGFAAQNNNFTVNSVIADDGAAAVHVNILGYMVLGGANTFTGGTTVAQGRVQAPNANSFGATGSTVTIYAGGQAFLNGNVTYNYNWIVNGVGSQESDGLGVFRGSNGKTVAGTITLASTAAFGAGNATGANFFNVTASIGGPGGLIVGHGTNNNGNGIMHFGDGTGAQHYTHQGDTTINQSRVANGTANTLFVNPGSKNLLAHGANRGNMVLNGNASSVVPNAILNLNGTSQTVNGLNSTGTDPTATSIVGGVGSVLAMGDNNASGSFAGVISTEISIRKIGSGTQTLTGANSYTGNTQVYGGVLSITSPFLPVAGNVAVTSGATFNLDFVGTNAVNALYFGAIGQATGTWGRPGSGAAHTDSRFTGDGLIDVQTLGSNLFPGDFDGSHTVDAANLALWQTETGFGGGADADYDGDSDGADFLIWQRNLGLSMPGVAASGAVPEPSAALLGALAVCALAGAKRRR